MLATTMLKIENLSKNYGDFTAVNGLNLELKPGEIFGFLGANGAGKTTTIKVCTGLLKPSEGSVAIGGYDIVKQSVEAKALLGYVPDNPVLYEKLSGTEFVRFVARIYSAYRQDRGGDDVSGQQLENSLEERIEELFVSFEMGEKKDELIQGYSRGMRQKTAIIAALIHKPKILLADEPTANLDPKSARLVKDTFRNLSQQGGTVLMSTHVMEIAERLCDRIGIIYGGKIIALGTLDEIKEQSAANGSTLEDLFLELTGGLSTEVGETL